MPMAIAITCALTTMAAQAQTFSVIHNFSGGQDGATPMAGLTMDRAGNLYGTANYGGNAGGNCGLDGCGAVFRLSNRNSSWLLTPLYDFAGGNDGANPQAASVVVGSDGSIFSTTFLGGTGCNGSGCGTVFNLQPPASACKTALCPWTETVLHRFTGPDGSGPVGTMVFDPSGNLYGVTLLGGLDGGGTVYQLTANNWTENILFHPYGYPGSGITPDHAGNFYGSTFAGGNNFGSIYELTPNGSGWTGNNIYVFADGSDGAYPKAGVIFDPAGNLYGATSNGGSGKGGTVFQLTPSNGSWIYSTLYSFSGPNNGHAVVGPAGNLVMDAASNLYGTTVVDGVNGYGAVFKLTPANGGWTYTSLHDFTNGSDGSYPYSNLVFDTAGNLYGTASAGGANGLGVVFKIAP
jgi:uncharacterized repeat protein (TIGR03803 family)